MASTWQQPGKQIKPQKDKFVYLAVFAKRKLVNLRKIWPDWLAIGFLNHLNDVYIYKYTLEPKKNIHLKNGWNQFDDSKFLP